MFEQLQSGSFNLINESELQEALRLKGETPKFFAKSDV
jgi:hypothetical protein